MDFLEAGREIGITLPKLFDLKRIQIMVCGLQAPFNR
jgi:hypothetical protein